MPRRFLSLASVLLKTRRQLCIETVLLRVGSDLSLIGKAKDNLIREIEIDTGLDKCGILRKRNALYVEERTVGKEKVASGVVSPKA